MTEPDTPGNDARPPRRRSLTKIISVLTPIVVVISGLVAFLANWTTLTGNTSAGEESGVPPTTLVSNEATTSPATTGRTTPPGGSDREPTSQAARGPNWYDLAEIRYVATGGGISSPGAIRIGKGEEFPNSFRGRSSSSVSSRNNSRTWLLGGMCSEIEVWVGKDAASPYDAGVGRFYVQGDGGDELGSAEATITDEPKRIRVSVAGVSRLTLLDTRNNSDAFNAWGRPRVFCDRAPTT